MADDPLADRAAFAQRFIGTTNLEQRRRFAQDISEAKKRDEDRRADEFERLQMDRPEVGNMVTNRMRENRLGREGGQKADLAERRFDFDMEKTTRMERLNADKMDLQLRKEQREISKAERDLQDAKRFEDDTSYVEEAEYALRARGLPGSEAYRDGLLNILARAPYIDPQFRRSLVEGARIGVDADELQADMAELVQKFPNAAITLGPNGKPTIRVPAPRDEKSGRIEVRRLDSLKKNLIEEKAKEKPDAEWLGYLENEIGAIDKQRQAQVKPTAPATAATPASTDQSVVDVNKARELIKEAGGDVNKARGLAKERGLKF